MININNAAEFIPHFGEADFTDIFTNKNNRVFAIQDSSVESFENYCKLFEEEGFAKREYRSHGSFHFAALEGKSTGVFVIFYGDIKEINITIENESKYFAYNDTLQDKKVSSQVTQVKLEDYGMSYVIRLSDGRFIVIDGGRKFEPDIDSLFKQLKETSPDEKPVIATWILTHPDCDHYHCFMGFCEKYLNEFILQKILFNFPEHDDFKLYHDLEKKGSFGSDFENLPKTYELIKKTGAEIHTPHTGQIYEIGNASCEILNCIGDVVHYTYWKNKNEPCLVIRMEIEGQTILWMGDASCHYSRLYEKFGAYLKSDILQITHHGFGCLGYEAEIACYDAIKPSVCFLPVSDYNCYLRTSAYRESTNHIITKLDIDELITGDSGKTITLPYTPPESAKWDYMEKYARGVMNSGAHCWYFTGLNTANKDDFNFSFLNAINQNANVEINIYFKGSSDIERIKATVPGSLNDICIINDEKIDGEWLFHNPNSLNKIGIHENTDFAVRFISDIPIVIFHKDHKATYHTSYAK